MMICTTVDDPGNILVVDDNLANLKTLEALLSGVGHRVRCAPNVRTAFMIIESLCPELILLDIRMPDMDGFEVCRRLKAGETTRNIPIIFISAADEVKDKVRGFEVGAVDYIEKPIQAAEVLARVKNHLQLSRLQKALIKAYDEVDQRVKERTFELEVASEALQLSLQTADDIVRAIPTGLFIYQLINQDLLLLCGVNPEAERLTGVTMNAFGGRDFLQIWLGEKAIALKKSLLQVVANKRKLDIEEFYYHDDKITDFFRISAFSMPNNRLGVAFEKITEQKKLAAALKNKTAHLEEAQRIAHVGSWEYFFEGGTLLCSAETNRFLGGTVGGINDILSKIHPEDGARLLSIIRLIQEDSQPQEAEFRVVRPDGRLRWMRGRCEYLGKKTPLARLAGTVLDITETKNYHELVVSIERSLASATGDEFFQGLVTEVARIVKADFVLVGEYDSNSPAEVSTLAVTNGIHLLKNFTYALHGTPCANVISGEFCIHPTNVQQLFPTDPLLVEMGIHGYAGTPLRNASGKVHGMLVALYRDTLPDPPLVRSALMVLGLRFSAELQRQKNHRDLETSRERYKNISQEFSILLDGIPDMIFRTTADMRVVWGNKAVEKTFSLPMNDILGHHCYELWHHQQQACADCPARRCFRTGNPEISLIPAANGRQWGIKAFPLLDGQGRVESVINIASDITERINERMEAGRSSRLASIGELAAGVAHEINNPINGIINYAQLLADWAAGESAEQEIANSIIEEGERIAGIVRALLSFSKDQGEEKGPVKLCEVVFLALNLTRNQLTKDNIEVTTVCPENLPAVLANHQQLQQVLLNFISNARYALNERFPNADRQKRLEISAGHSVSPKKKCVWLEVFDQGTGISRHNLEKVRNPFFTTKPTDKGTGLGLSISYGIVEAHGGELHISSSENEWTKIRIELPSV